MTAHALSELTTEDAFKTANDLAYRYFEFHAEQRLKHLNYFLIVAGFCVAGFFAALQAHNRTAASVVSIVLVGMCYCFKQLDRRTAQLTKIAEDYLKESLEVLAARLNSRTLNFVARAEDKGSIWSHRKTLNFIFGLFCLLGVFGTIFPWLPKV